MRRPSARRAAAALLATVGLSVTTAGCVSMPSGGPVLPFPVSQSANAQNPNSLQFVPQPPKLNGTPSEIVSGFLDASSSFVGQQQVAREYLTPTAARAWKPDWSATVYKDSPTVTDPAPRLKQKSASVTVKVSVQATLSGNEEYAVASAAPKNATFHFKLVNYRGQWRIANTHGIPLLLTSTEFAADYQLVNLYFFDPSGQYLVPDPVYVPLEDTEGDLVKGLVHYLIAPPPDWLGQGSPTHTAFPPGTAPQESVTLDGGTASVNLAGKAVTRLSDTVKEQISAQLWWTLSGAGQGQQQVKSITLSINGKPFVPAGNALGNPVQNQANQYRPANGPAAGGFYYLKPAGQLVSRAGQAARPTTIATLGRDDKSLTVSPDGRYLAVVRNGTLYTGSVGGPLLPRTNVVGIITSLSWDRYGYLWVVAGMNVSRLPPSPPKPAIPVPTVQVPYRATCGSTPEDVTALRVAPDGVRVAIVFGGPQETLAFGAIVIPSDAQPRREQQSQVSLNLSPFFVCGTAHAFTALSWYGADGVIALDAPDDTVTDYPVNGGTPTEVPGPPGSTWITASSGRGLIVSQGSTLSMAPNLSSAWSPLGRGSSPAFPG